jgi:hypothetical protein
MAVTTWNIAPDYDEWGYDTWWSCEDWVMWHQELKKHFGDDKARKIWEYAFNRSGNLSGNLSCVDFNKRFREYQDANNLKTNVFLEGVMGDVIDIPSNVIDFASDAVSNTADFFSGSTTKRILTITLVVGSVVALAYAYKAFKTQ